MYQLRRRGVLRRLPAAFVQELEAKADQVKQSMPYRRRIADNARHQANRAAARPAANASQRARGAPPRCSEADEIISAIHEATGYQVSANAERLNLPRFKDRDPAFGHVFEYMATVDEYMATLLASQAVCKQWQMLGEYAILRNGALKDICENVRVTEGDKERMTDCYQAVMKQNRKICACASCGMRDLQSLATKRFVLEDLPEKHWLRYTSDARQALDDLVNSPLLEDGKLKLMDKDGASHLVDLRHIKSYFKSDAERVLPTEQTATLGGVTDDDARRYFHVHPELVVERERNDERVHDVLLCDGCAKAAKDGIKKENRAAPKGSIAKGVDYGFLERLCGLEQSSERCEVRLFMLPPPAPVNV